MNKSDRRKIEKLLRHNGFVFVEKTTHNEVWKHPDGREMRMPSEFGSDTRGWASQRSDLRRLGIKI